MRRAKARQQRARRVWKIVLTSVGFAFFLASCVTIGNLFKEKPVPNSKISTSSSKAAAGDFRRDTLLVAIPSDEAHLPLVRASRSWRKGIRTVVAVNDTRLAKAISREGRQWKETWLSYPDDDPLRGNYPGDTRAALVPFIAHKALGSTYRWLLYGDDDTQWFVEGVLKLVKNLDHNLPYFITDNMWWSSVNGTIGSQPNLEAPRCLPCGYSAYGKRPAGDMQFDAPEGCPCRPELLCQADRRRVFDSDCNIPLHLVPAFSTRTYSMHGGAGGLISVGLLNAVTLEEMEACIRDQGHSTGGDAFISICLWKLGFAHTDPGPWFNDPSMRLFDAAAGLSSSDLASKLTSAAQGRCAESLCGELFENMVTSHVHSRKAGSIREAADIISLLSQSYDQFAAARKLGVALQRERA